MFTMLCGCQPFHAQYSKDLIQKIKEEEPSFDSDLWQRVSPKAKHLVQLLLEKNPKKRPNIVAVLRHSWFSKQYPDEAVPDYAHLKFRLNLLRNQRKLSRNSKGEDWEQVEEEKSAKPFTLTREEVACGSMEDKAFYFSM